MGGPVRAPRRGKSMRHNPLAVDIAEIGAVKPERRRGKSVSKDRSVAAEQLGGQTVSAELSKKILAVAKSQVEDLDGKVRIDELENGDAMSDKDEDLNFLAGEEGHRDEEADIQPFMAPFSERNMGLADFVAQNKRDKETKRMAKRLAKGSALTSRRASMMSVTSSAAATSSSPAEASSMPEEAVEAYKQVGLFMRRYKSGKLPRLFAVIPRLANWEEVLYYTEPQDWSPNALGAATKLFASNLNPKMAQRFYNLVLLPAFRENLAANKKLNPHIYGGLKKAMFKPDAWFKGILLPLAQDGCTYLEAVVLSSILKRVSIPVLHAAAALMKLSLTKKWYGSTSIMMTALIDKKFALPTPLIDALVIHFAKFEERAEALPVVWHRCFLTFAQRYKEALTEQHRIRLQCVLYKQRHSEMTPEVERELFAK